MVVRNYHAVVERRTKCQNLEINTKQRKRDWGKKYRTTIYFITYFS